MTRPAQWLSLGCLLGLVTACSSGNGTTPIYFTGACDASAAVALNDDLFVVANDEDNTLRVYSRLRPGAPLARFDLTTFLRPEKATEESDLEAAAQVGERIYWISSHGRNAKGKKRETRHRFFATGASITNGAVQLKPEGDFYAHLLDDMFADARLASFNLKHAAELAPKTPGALNIEGLCATPEGHLLIGFRNPVPQGKALVLPLLNPAGLIAGERAKFGEPVLLDFQGYGIRSIAYWRDRYIIVAGPTDGQGQSRLYQWFPNQAPQPFPAPEIDGLNPEAVAFYGQGGRADLFVVSDDGTTQIGREECKKIKDPMKRRFRAVYVAPPGSS